MTIVHLSIFFGEMSILILYSFLNWVLCLFTWSCKKFFLGTISFAPEYNLVAPSAKIFWMVDSFYFWKCHFFHIYLFSIFWWQSATVGCGNIPVGRFRVCFCWSQEVSGVSLWDLRILHGVKSHSTFTNGQAGDWILPQNPIFLLTAWRSDLQNFFGQSFLIFFSLGEEGVPAFWRSLSFSSLPHVSPGYITYPPPGIGLIPPGKKYHPFLLFHLWVSTSLLPPWDFLLFLWSLILYYVFLQYVLDFRFLLRVMPLREVIMACKWMGMAEKGRRLTAV